MCAFCIFVPTAGLVSFTFPYLSRLCVVSFALCFEASCILQLQRGSAVSSGEEFSLTKN